MVKLVKTLSIRLIIPAAALCLALGPLPGCSDDPPVNVDQGVGTPDRGPGSDADLGPQPDGKLDPDGGGSSALKPGILGKYSALAVAGGNLLASAYEQTYGDLVLVTAATSAPGTMKYEVVDGVPQATPTADPKGYRGGISEAGDNVGLDTDIAVDSSGTPSIAYHDATSKNRSLKFATRAGGKWSAHHVDKAKGKKEQVGRYTSLIWVGGKPAIAYAAIAADGSKTGSFKSELRWAAASKAAPTATADWTVQVIDSAPMSCQELCDKSTELCVLNGDGSSQCQTKGSGCSGCSKTQGCVGGKCVNVLTPTGVTDVPKAVGLWASAVNTSAGPVVLYHDGVKGTLKAAKLGGGKWTSATLKGGGKESVGAFASAAADSSGTVHVAYQDRIKTTLHYLQLNPSTMKATVSETIDTGLRSDGQHPVGADVALAVAASGAVKVIYQDQMTADLLYATRSGTNSWTPNTTSNANLGRLLKGGAKGYGFFSDAVASGTTFYGSTFYFDVKGSPEGGLELFSIK